MNNKKKSAGGLTTYERLGKEVTRTSHNEGGNVSKTIGQDMQRRRMANVQKLWKAFDNAGWKPRFQDKNVGQSDYNRFVSSALQGTNIYLTKLESLNNACVLVPVTVSAGSLPPIETHFDGIGVVSDIIVGDLVITPATTIGELSRAIIYNNDNILKGDLLTFIAGTQKVRPLDNMPVASFRHCTIRINTLDNHLLSSLRGSDEAFLVRSGLLSSTVSAGVCTWVHARPGDPDQFSTQTLWCSNSEWIERYHSEEALDASSQSYGGLHPNGVLEPDTLPDDLAGRR